MDEQVYREYVAILKEELQPAMGCTEPIAVAYCAALARKTLGALPETVEVLASANIIKNVKSVIVPNTNGQRGIAAAAAAGIVADNADAQLQVLASLTPEQVDAVGAYLQQAAFTVRRADKDYVFDIQVRVTAGADSASVEIAHTIVNAIAIDSGMICDGAKASCAAKIASAVEAGLLGMQMQMHESQFYGGDGIVVKGVENTIRNIGTLASEGMRETDRTIIRMMIQEH